MALRVLHLVGSAVSNFLVDLSCLYARGCLEATADPERYEVHLAYVTPDRPWRFPTDLGPEAIAEAPTLSLAGAVQHLAGLELDLVVPQMFCLPGMTTYRGLADLLGVPYLGNAPETMALGADKALARAVVAAAGVSVPVGEVLRRGQEPRLAPPTVVKPVDADNSLGVSLVREPEEYGPALETAFANSEAVLVESYVELGREVRCGVLERGGELICLPLEEYAVDATTKPIRGYDDKVRREDDGGLRLVAKDVTRAWIVDPEDPVVETVWAAARECHVALGCRDYSLFDFRIDPDGRPWFLEAGLYCSFAPTSVVAVMAAATGVEIATLFAEAVEETLARTTGTPTS